VRRTLLTPLLVLLLAPAADGATRHVVRGAGFGHGVGLCQYGAYGYAQNGRSYREILRHYYSGTRIGRAGNRPVRVLLQASHPYVRFRGASRLAGVRDLDRRATYRVAPSRGRLGLYRRGRLVGRYRRLRVYRRRGVVRLLGRAINGFRHGRYRGALDLLPGASGGVTAVNRIKVDQYIYGVVPGEVPSTWHSEVLKAQAVAARTYALATRKTGGVFDLYPDTRSQVYEGVAGETASTNSAVRATARQIVTYEGEPIVAYYFSTSGGHTENVENSFLGSDARPYLRGVSDPFDDISPRHRWSLRFTSSRMDARLGRYSPGRFRKIRVLRRGVSPRVIRARVYGTRGTRIISGPALRSRLGLYDSWAYFSTVSTSQVRGLSAFSSGWGAAPFTLVIRGVFDPAPRRRRLAVERRSGRRWVRVGTARTTRRGSYRTSVRRRGVYRVRGGAVAGPAVRVL
jgi:stage II sporulation protein D